MLKPEFPIKDRKKRKKRWKRRKTDQREGEYGREMEETRKQNSKTLWFGYVEKYPKQNRK